MSKDQPSVFVIAPENVPVQVRKPHVVVLRFSNSYEFERWRQGPCAHVAAAVRAALADLGIDLEACSPRTRDVIARLTERENVPLVKELVGLDSSRRSFYRWWMRDIRETPAAFLERVRLLHVRTALAFERVAQLGTPDAADSVR
jgi:hypothetical protein